MTRLHFSRSLRLLLALALVSTALAAFVGATSAAGPAGQVYTITNDPDGNQIAIYNRASNGLLTLAGFVDSGGNGTGVGLGSQGAVILSNDSRWLFAVNAGSDSISSFRVTGSGLSLVDTVDSGGNMPTSLTVHGNLLYVLNAGTPNIAGFTVDPHGHLTMIANSTQPAISVTSVQVGFSPDGRVLIVAGKESNTINSYLVDDSGVAGPPQMFTSNAPVPFGFEFDKRGHLIMSEASGFVTPYSVAPDGTVSAITGAEKTFQSAACWIVITKNGKYTYTTNAGSHSITGFAIAHDGSLSILDADGITADTGADTAPIDMALSNNSQFLYVNNGNGTIGAFEVHADGSLSPLGAIGGVPTYATGLASK